MYYKLINRAGRMLLYIPYKKRYDIVRTVFINNVLNYCVNDFGKFGNIANSSYVWDKYEGQYLQYAPSIKNICKDDFKMKYRCRLEKNS